MRCDADLILERFQDTLHLVQAIHLLSKAIPQIITVSKATALLPYLRPASSVCVA